MIKKLVSILTLIIIAENAGAQISGYNLSEFQLGNIPGYDPADLFTGYDQLNLNYRYKNFRVSTRLEGFYKSVSPGNNYFQLSQLQVNYRKKGLDLRIGNFYTTLGRGLLLRGYEIKNSIIEDQVYRVRQGFYKDIKGFYGAYHNRHFSVKAVAGSILNNQLPPSSDDKRIDEVYAGEAKVNIAGQYLGLIYLENHNPTSNTRYLSSLAEGSFLNNFNYYAEFAGKAGNHEEYFTLSKTSSFGFYGSLNYSIIGFGASIEYKNYQNFLIGSGITDPPTLTKEHTYRLLNRSTHIPELFNESGVQAEFLIQASEKSLVTVNYSRGANDIGTNFHFQEFFAEIYTRYSTADLKYFIDYGSDGLKLEKNRFTTGFNYGRQIWENKWHIATEFEIQYVERSIDFQKTYQNIYGGLILSKSSRFSAGLMWEFTNNQIIADLANTEKVERKKHYPGLAISYKPNSNHSFSLFAGERRGGPACTSGICYEILDFKGIELRYSTRF